MNEYTLYQLERERKNKILNLNPDEADRYIHSLNKRMAAAYGNVDNDFTPDMEASEKAADLCDEVVELLKKTYPNVSEVMGWSRVEVLVDKLRETANDVHDMKLERTLHNLRMAYLIMGKELIILKNIMWIYYDFYKCSNRYDNIFYVIDKTSLSDKEKRKVINALDELPVYDFYNQHLMDNMDILLQLLLRSMEQDYNILKGKCNFSFIDEEVTDDDFYVEFRDSMLEYQQLSKDLLTEYEAYMDDGFHHAKEMERQILCEMWNEDGHTTDKDYVDYIQYNRPSYDLRTMTFIPSQHELDKMDGYNQK